jgi:hypothetical protein
MPKLFWSAPDGPADQQVQSFVSGQGSARMVAVPVPQSDVFPAGLLSGQLIYFDALTSAWMATPTAPADGQRAQWSAANNAWEFVPDIERYPVIADAVSGIVQSFQPVGLGPDTTNIRLTLGANAAILGMPLEDGQEITLRLSRTVPASFTLAIPHEDTGAIAATERFNTPQSTTLFLRAGEGVLIRNSGGRNNVQATGETHVKVIGRNQGTVSATNATTELSCGGVLTFLPNMLVSQLSQLCLQFDAHFEFVHTADPTPLIDVGFAINGIAFYSSLTPTLVAGTYHGSIQAIARLISPGPTASWRTTVQWKNSGGLSSTSQIGGATGLPGVNTTVQNTIELRMRMQTAVPGNTLAIYNALAKLLG